MEESSSLPLVDYRVRSLKLGRQPHQNRVCYHVVLYAFLVVGLLSMTIAVIPVSWSVLELMDFVETSDFMQARKFEHEHKEAYNATVLHKGEESWDSCFLEPLHACATGDLQLDAKCRKQHQIGVDATKGRWFLGCHKDYRPYLLVEWTDPTTQEKTQRCAYRYGISIFSDTDAWYHPVFKGTLLASHRALRVSDALLAEFQVGQTLQIWTAVSNTHPFRCVVGFGNFKRYLDSEEGQMTPWLVPWIVGLAFCVAGTILCARAESLSDWLLKPRADAQEDETSFSESEVETLNGNSRDP